MSPHRTKHVPFWPFLVVFVLLIAAVIAGAIASDRARDEQPETPIVTTTTVPPAEFRL